MYGMNFKNIPEYDWTYGYAYGLCLIFGTAMIPLCGSAGSGGSDVSSRSVGARAVAAVRAAGAGTEGRDRRILHGRIVAALLTEIAGSSDVVERGFVTYSNDAKQDLLGVSAQTLASEGAVSQAAAREMALGALARSRADVAVSITGVAGPGGGSLTKPVGLVHFGCAQRGGAVTTVERRFGDLGRGAVRLASVEQAISMLETAAREGD